MGDEEPQSCSTVIMQDAYEQVSFIALSKGGGAVWGEAKRCRWSQRLDYLEKLRLSRQAALLSYSRWAAVWSCLWLRFLHNCLII